MTRKRFWIALSLIIIMVLLSPVAMMVWHFTRPFGTGSPERAREWKAKFDPINTPEEAEREFGDEVSVLKFENGEWVFGISENSHYNPDGGTIVVKDCTGKVRAFFGHVCGPRRLNEDFGNSKSLKEFYNSPSFEHWEFREYHFD